MSSYHTRVAAIVAVVMIASACAGGAKTGTQGEPKPARSSADVTAADLANSPSQPIEQILQSKVAGATVVRTEDGGIAIRIRGASTVNGSSAPLYVIDGVALEPGPNGSLVGINPYDIASIKVLKEAADLSMYGSRGANGVIVIKTKKPHQ